MIKTHYKITTTIVITYLITYITRNTPTPPYASVVNAIIKSNKGAFRAARAQVSMVPLFLWPLVYINATKLL